MLRQDDRQHAYTGCLLCVIALGTLTFGHNCVYAKENDLCTNIHSSQLTPDTQLNFHEQHGTQKASAQVSTEPRLGLFNVNNKSCITTLSNSGNVNLNGASRLSKPREFLNQGERGGGRLPCSKTKWKKKRSELKRRFYEFVMPSMLLPGTHMSHHASGYVFPHDMCHSPCGCYRCKSRAADVTST